MSVERTVIRTLPIPSLPGWESQLILLRFPPGSKVAPHTHPVSGISFIVKGNMISHYEGQDVKEHVEGDSFIDPAETLHIRTENASEDEWLYVTVSYVAKKGQVTAIPA